jgi:hypothetical protein
MCHQSQLDVFFLFLFHLPHVSAPTGHPRVERTLVMFSLFFLPISNVYCIDLHLALEKSSEFIAVDSKLF